MLRNSSSYVYKPPLINAFLLLLAKSIGLDGSIIHVTVMVMHNQND